MSRFQAVRRETRWHGGQVPYAYRPRDYLKQPRFFGRKIDAEWKPFGDDSTERARVAAAYWQHLAACETLRIAGERGWGIARSEEHTSELQSRENLVCRLLLEKKKKHPMKPCDRY